MARGKKAHDTSDVSDPSDHGFDSDDSMKNTRPPKKKMVKKEHQKGKGAARKPSPKKRKDVRQAEEAGGSKDADSEEDDEQKNLVEEYDEDDLVNIVVPPKPIPCMQLEGGDRLIITDIMVENFKSYYGVRRIGPFHHNFTSIIGPNGSGKSNVIDALLFVFGYKASKIRSKKVSVLIHSSKGKDNLQSCTVKISFQKVIDQPDGTYEVVPNSSFNVSRTAYKSNMSEYRMNGDKVTFKEVARRLRDVGIDLIHNRFLILQGEVEQIALMKPKSVNGTEDGMLEYLEDIIGSSRFKVPIEKLTEKLEKLQGEKSHQNARVNAALREKEAMDGPVKNQLDYLTMENEVTVLTCKQKLAKIYNMEDAAEALIPEIAKTQAELEKVDKDLLEVADKLKEKKKNIDALRKAIDKLDSKKKDAQNAFEVIQQNEKKRKLDLERVLKEVKKMQNEVKKEQSKLVEAQQAPIDAKAKIEQLEIQLTELKEELSTAQEMFDENFPKYNKKTEADRAKKTKLEEEYSGVAEKLAEAEAQLKLAESSFRSMSEEFEKKKGQLEQLEKTMEASREKIEQMKKQRVAAEETVKRAEEETKKARKEQEEILARTEECNARIRELQPLLTEKNQEALSRHNDNKTTELLEKAVRDGALHGYHGRLGDLGSIDPKYDRAISNNFGILDSYVVEDNQAFYKATAILKAHGLRGNFMFLNQQASQWPKIKQLLAEKNPIAPRLFSMVKCEDKYKPAFFNPITTTYVVDDMKAAHDLRNKLMNERKQVTSIVTLDGNMLTSKGTFIGGGQVKEGKMSAGAPKVVRRDSSVRDDERNVKKMEEARKEVQSLEQEMQTLQQRDTNLARKLMAIADPRLTAQTEAERMAREIKRSEDVLKIQEQQRVQKEGEVKAAKVDEKEVEKKEKEIETLKKNRDEAAAEAKSSKAKIKAIDGDMAKIYNKLVKPHEESRDSARISIENAEKDLSKQKAIVSGAERNIASQTKRVADVSADLDQKRGKSSNFVELGDTHQKRENELKETLEQTDAEMKEKMEEKDTVAKSHQEFDSQEVAIHRHKQLLLEKMGEAKFKQHGLIATIKELSNQVDQLKLTNIAELTYDIPDEMRQSSANRLFLLDGESGDDLDDYEEFMTGSPTKKKALKDMKKEKKEEVKRRKLAEQRREEEEGDSEEEEETEGRGEGEEEGERENGEEEMAATNEGEEEEGGGEGREEGEGLGGEEENGEAMDVEEGIAEGEEELDEDERRERKKKKKEMEKKRKEKERQKKRKNREETAEEMEARKEERRKARKAKREKDNELIKNGQMPTWSREHIKKCNKELITMTLDDLVRRMAMEKKHLVPHILKDYKAKVAKLRLESQHLQEITKKYTDHREKLEMLKKERLADFMGGFESISTALREMYQMITLGGDASLELKDLIDPFLEGVQFMVRPPKKSWKQIENLSGGEKTLSSLALVFALHKYRPTPLYVMDEIDAALDFRNVSIIGHYIKDRTKNAQFIIISLRNNMFELADRLIGIYKVHDCTRNVVVDPKRVLEETKELRSGLDKVRRLMESNKIHTGVGI